MEAKPVFTIGYSYRNIDDVIDSLLERRVNILVDLRSTARSTANPNFNPGKLQSVCSAESIEYVYLGDRLGGRPKGRKFYDAEGRLLYSELAKDNSFQKGIKQLLALVSRGTVCLMNVDEDPTDCPRHRCIGRMLADHGVRVFHIRRRGPDRPAEDTPGFRYDENYREIFGEENEWRSAASVLFRKYEGFRQIFQPVASTPGKKDKLHAQIA
jgi:uncharacterized protein (DUF488 family)